MKKFVLAAAAVTVAMAAMAEGYQINTLSTRQLGMAHTGTALKLGSQSQYFNPAGMAFLDKTLDVSASFTGIMATAKADYQGETYETDNGVSTPMMFDAAFSIYPNLKAGISFYTPYGSSINWTDNWPGAVLNQSVSLKVFTVQPTVAWQITPRLSVGAGLMLSWGSVNLNKGLVPAATLDKVLGAPVFGLTTPASINLQGTTPVKVGVNLGAMFDITDRITVGVSWRSQMNMNVKAGEASVTYANETAQTVLQKDLNVLNHANFKAEMPAPWMLSLGASWRPIDRLTLALDARMTGWAAYKALDIEFLSEQLAPYNQHLEKNYRNCWAFSLGGEYGVTNRFDVRAGVMVDTTPCNANYYNPETPGMTKIEPSVGLSFRPIKNLSVDVAFMYVAGLGKTGSAEYTDLLAAKLPALGLPATQTFEADYHVSALIPSIGLNFSF